jgi:WD40 repeat protein
MKVPLRSRQVTEPTPAEPAPPEPVGQRGVELVLSFECADHVHGVAWTADGNDLAAATNDGRVMFWSWAAPTLRKDLRGHRGEGVLLSISPHPLDRMVATTAAGTVRVWDLDGETSRVLNLNAEGRGLCWSPDGRMLAVGDRTGMLRILDAQSGRTLRRTNVASGFAICWSSDNELIVVTGEDRSIRVCAAEDLRQLRTLTGHREVVVQIVLSPDGSCVASASLDHTVRIWDLHSGKENVVLEGHTGAVHAVRFSPDGEFLASQSNDRTVRLWRCRDWACVAVLRRADSHLIGGLDFHPHEPILATKDLGTRRIDCLRLDYDVLLGTDGLPESRRYVNAKVVLLGDTGVGKSGLGLVLSGQPYQPTDSTHGRNVWTFDSQELEVGDGGRQTREVLLWDLAGQPGYRMVHQLHLNEVAVALVVFDSRSETDPFAGVKHWVRALAQARRLEGGAAVPLRTYLVAARADRGGVGVTAERVRAVLDELGLDGFFETSAKEGWQVAELVEAIRSAISWDALPMVSSSNLFESIRHFLLKEKQRGRLLSTADDLFRAYRLTQPDTSNEDEPGLVASFRTCIGRLEGRGLIRRLRFGDYVLLQPELLDAYASAMVQAARDEPDGLGFISERDALAGTFRLPEAERVADPAQEKLLLIATVEELLRHEIALKEITDEGVDLVFPSQFTRERPDAPDIPGKAVTITFEGPLHSVYATLAVRLSHSMLFRREAMWQNAASYTATVGGGCGMHLRELEEGRGELALFFDERANVTVRRQFEAYVFEHLQLRALAGTVRVRRIRMCPACGYTLPDELIRLRLDLGATTITCPVCDGGVIVLLDAPPAEPATAEAAVAAMNRSADAGRDRDVAATTLKGKIETGDYDVFLCHSSRDKEAVKAIGERLKERGILPWLDVWEIRPGTRWQKTLERQLTSIKSAAVFIGRGKSGPWQDIEVETLLQEFARRQRPIIPVILPGRQGSPRLPKFLGLWHVVDMRQPDPDPFEQLAWGITGQRDQFS